MSSDGRRIWSNRFDREGDDPFAHQDELAATLASKAAPEIDAHEKALAKLRQGDQPAAVKHVEAARELFP